MDFKNVRVAQRGEYMYVNNVLIEPHIKVKVYLKSVHVVRTWSDGNRSSYSDITGIIRNLSENAFTVNGVYVRHDDVKSIYIK